MRKREFNLRRTPEHRAGLEYIAVVAVNISGLRTIALRRTVIISVFNELLPFRGPNGKRPVAAICMVGGSGPFTLVWIDRLRGWEVREPTAREVNCGRQHWRQRFWNEIELVVYPAVPVTTKVRFLVRLAESHWRPTTELRLPKNRANPASCGKFTKSEQSTGPENIGPERTLPSLLALGR